MKESKGQVSVEYLSTYGIAILIVSVIAVALYLLVSVPTSSAPSLCNFAGYVNCKISELGTSSAGTRAVLLLSNPQQYAIENASMTMNFTGVGNLTASCYPSYILPGGYAICVLNTTKKVTPYQFVGGKLSLSTTVCTTPGVTCGYAVRQTYGGSFSGHINPFLPSPQCTLSLTVENSSQLATGQEDRLISNVKLFNTNVAGATVSVTTNSPTTIVTPGFATTDSNGNAISYASSTSAGNVTVNATFATCSVGGTISFDNPVYITFTINQSIPDPPTVFKLGTTAFSGFPVTKALLPITSSSAKSVTTSSNATLISSQPASNNNQAQAANYTYNTSIVTSAGVRLIFNHASGCGHSTLSQSGLVNASVSCTVTGYYKNQAYITMQSNPSGAGSPTPSSGWYNLGSVSLSPNPNSGYVFSSWSGSGSGSYTGSSQSPSVTLTSPVTETANYQVSKYTVTTYANPVGDGTETGAGNYTSGSIATITANPASGWTLSSWSCTGSASQYCPSGNQSSFEFQVTSAATVTANYDPSQYYLTLYYECEDGSGQQLWGNYGPYNYGQQVTLPGILDEYYDSSEGSYCQFSYWYGQMGWYPYQYPQFIIPYGGYYGSYPGEVFSSSQTMTAFFTTYCPFGGNPPYNCYPPPTTTSVTSTTSSTSTIGFTSSTTTSTTTGQPTYYGVTIQESPSAAANDWGACFQATNPNTGQIDVNNCAGPYDSQGSYQGDNSNSNTGQVPAGDYISYVCTADWSGGQSYSFSSFSGFYNSGNSCASGNFGTINGPTTIQANYQQVTTTTTPTYYEYSCNDQCYYDKGTTSLFGSTSTCEVQSSSSQSCEPSSDGSSFTVTGTTCGTQSNGAWFTGVTVSLQNCITCTNTGVSCSPSNQAYNGGESINGAYGSPSCGSGQMYLNGNCYSCSSGTVFLASQGSDQYAVCG